MCTSPRPSESHPLPRPLLVSRGQAAILFQLCLHKRLLWRPSWNKIAVWLYKTTYPIPPYTSSVPSPSLLFRVTSIWFSLCLTQSLPLSVPPALHPALLIPFPFPLTGLLHYLCYWFGTQRPMSTTHTRRLVSQCYYTRAHTHTHSHTHTHTHTHTHSHTHTHTHAHAEPARQSTHMH